MSEVRVFKCVGYMEQRSRIGGERWVSVDDFDRVTAERDAALERIAGYEWFNSKATQNGIELRLPDRVELRALLDAPAKPVIEISLELLNTACNGFVQEQGHALNELREILSAHKVDKNVKSTSAILDSTHIGNSSNGDSNISIKTVAAQPQGEPVDREQKVTELSEFMSRLSGGLRHFAGQIIDAGWKKCGPQSSEPIGFRDPEFLWATISSENKAKMESCGHDLSCFSVPLYAEQPAPVAVVLPEPVSAQEFGDESMANGWNACLDEVTRLNTK